MKKPDKEAIEAKEAASKLLGLLQDRVTSTHEIASRDPQWCQVRHVFILYRDLAYKASAYLDKQVKE